MEALILGNGKPRTLVLQTRVMAHKEVLLSCSEYWETTDDMFDEPETEDATYFLSESDIDMLIEKLTEAKSFLNSPEP